MLYNNYIKNSNKDGYSRVFRSPKSLNKLISYLNVRTLCDVFIFGYKKNPKANCLGEIKELNPIRYDWLTYSNVLDAATILGTRLLDESYLTYQHTEGNIDSSKFIGILLQNNSNYVITELACHLFSFISIPIYETFSPSIIEIILNQTKLKILFIENKHIEILLQLTNYHDVIKIVSYQKIDNDIIDFFRKKGIDIIEYNDFRREIICKQFIAPKPGFVAMICYTPGTTNQPKGVIVTHENIIASMTGQTYNDIIFNHRDVYISYLPLSHMFEKTIIASIFYGGGSIGFSRGNIELLLDEVKSLKPTIFPSFPVLYNRIYDIIMNNINSNTLSKNLFNIGYKLAKYDYKVSNMFLEKTLFKSIRDELGGKVRLLISGVSTIDPKILDFMKVCFRCNVMQIYGLSETTSCISIINHHDKNLNNVGCPSVCGEICVKSDYSVDNNIIEGELFYRGANLFRGYYSGSYESCGNEYQIDSIITDKLIDKDGWFHTGDFVKILNNGAIGFIDRISNIIKLDNGESISFEKIERLLETVPNIYQSFVYGENAKSTIIALLVLKDRTQIPNIEIDINAHIKTIFQNSELYDFEIPSRILILDAPFTLQNGLLTPTFKLQRQQIIKKYITLINKIY